MYVLSDIMRTLALLRCKNLQSLWHLNFQQQVFVINAWYLHVHQHLHRCLRLSVLTRTMPWGVPGPPLVRNRGPVRTLGGQSERTLQMICPLHEVPTWSNMAYTCVYDLITMHAPIFAMHVGPTKVNKIKLKTLNLLTSRSCLAGILQGRRLVRTLKA